MTETDPKQAAASLEREKAQTPGEALTELIQKLEKLKEAIERHSAYHQVRGRSHLGLSPDSTERSFIEAVKKLIDQADLSLVGLEDCIVQHSLPTDGLGGHYFPPSRRFGHDLLHDIRYAITSCYREETSTTDSKEVNRLILHLKKVLQRVETEAAKPMPPTPKPTVEPQGPGLEDAVSDEAVSGRPMKPPNISGMSWQEAKKKAEKYLADGNTFPGITELRKAIGGCHYKTMRRAINESEILKEAEQQHNAHHGTPKAVSLTDKILAGRKSTEETDPSILADTAERTEALLKRLVGEQARSPAEKAEAEARIDNMSQEEKQELADTCAQQLDDDQQNDPQKKGRKPRRRKP
jgi:hypothetical protein